MDKIPLADDEAFLKAIKDELLGLKKRLRHETLQKLQLLKQIKEFRTRESELQEKAERLAKLEEGKSDSVDAGTQYESQIDSANAMSQPSDLDGFKHISE